MCWLRKNLEKIFGLNVDFVGWPIYYMDEGTKKYKTRVWRCPKCTAKIKWSCNGPRGFAMCSNSLRITRNFALDDLETMLVCDWEGFVERRPDGKVEIYYYSPI